MEACLVSNTRHANMNIELLRIVAMLLVLSCHATIHLGWNLLGTPGIRFGVANTIVQFGQVGVCIFFMISGYFLVHKSFTVRRIVSSWTQMFCYSVLILLLTLALRHFGLALHATEDCFANADAILLTFAKELFPFYTNAYWFMGTYLVLLCVMPFINAIMEHCSRHDVFLLLGMMMVLSVTTRLFLSSVLAFSQLLLSICCYLIGAYARMYPDSYRRVRQWQRVASVVACIALMVAFNTVALSNAPIVSALGWNQYGIYHDGIIPCFVLIAYELLTCCLYFSDRDAVASNVDHVTFWSRHQALSHLVAAGGAGTFGCYLLHENYLGWHIFWAVVNNLVTKPAGTLHIIASFIVLVIVLYLVLLLVATLLDLLITNPIRQRIMIALPER